MKKTLISLFVSLTLVGTCAITSEISASYYFNKNYAQFWKLADKSSTIEAKQRYISKFVSALEAGNSNGRFSSHNAIWLKTDDNSFEAHLTALKTLESRLNEIKGMNPSSFEYNTAIQQITGQEQGEAREMIAVFEGCFCLANYPVGWNWIGDLAGIFCLIGFLLIGFLISPLVDCYNYHNSKMQKN